MGLSSLMKATSLHTPTSPTADKTAGGGAPEIDANDAETEVLDEEPKNLLLGLVKQLTIGMDLSKITLPVFVLEPRSMLERVTDFHSHPELLHGAGALASPDERFIQVLRYYLAGWHIKPKGVKKPYNPVLGEFFRCRYDYPDGTVAYYVAEQVSHHPPISAWYFSSPENKIDICGDLRPKSKFLGNSAATIMEGSNHVTFLDREEDGEYDITMPNMYARGILFGKMVMELCDTATVKNDKNGLVCDLDFKAKGFFSGSYNALAGKIKGPKGEVGEVTGKWSDIMDINIKGKGKEVLFDSQGVEVTSKVVAPEDQQAPNESRRLWSKVTAAIKAKDVDTATVEKTAIEDAQRNANREREEKGGTFTPRFFEFRGGEWRPTFSIPKTATPKEQRDRLRAYIYGDDFEPPFTIASPSSSSSSPAAPPTVAQPPPTRA